MSYHELGRNDELLTRSPRAPRLHSFADVRKQYRRTVVSRATVAIIGAAGVAVALAFALVPQVPQPEGSAAAVSRPIELSAGLTLAAPSGALIAVADSASVRFYDSSGRVLAVTSSAVRYMRWLADASGLVAQLDREGATTTTRLPFVVVERDGRLTFLGADLAGAAAAYLSVSPDGRTIATQDEADIVLLDRAGVAPPRSLIRATLVGWDARGRVLARDGAKLYAVASDGATVAIGLPVGADARLEARLSPDHTGTVIAAAGLGWSFEDDRLVPLPAGVAGDLFVGPRELLGRREDGRLVAYDVRAGTSRALNAVVDHSTWRAVRAISDGILVSFTPLGGEAILVDLATGEARALRGLPAASTLQALGAGRFLVTGGATRVLSFADP